MPARDELYSTLRALSRLEALELPLLEAALGCTGRETGRPEHIVSAPPSRYWVLEGPTRAFAERRFEIRGSGSTPFIVLELALAEGLLLSAADVEPPLQDLPFGFQPDHASFPEGPRIVGTSYQFAVPAGTLWLSFRDVTTTRFGAAGLSTKIDQVLEGAKVSSPLERVVLNNAVSKLDPASTLARLRGWAPASA